MTVADAVYDLAHACQDTDSTKLVFNATMCLLENLLSKECAERFSQCFQTETRFGRMYDYRDKQRLESWEAFHNVCEKYISPEKRRS